MNDLFENESFGSYESLGTQAPVLRGFALTIVNVKLIKFHNVLHFIRCNFNKFGINLRGNIYRELRHKDPVQLHGCGYRPRPLTLRK